MGLEDNMDDEGAKRLFYLSVAVLLDIILIWVGSKLLFLPRDAISNVQFTATGLMLIVGGIFAVATPDIHKSLRAGFIVIAVGFYFCARAAGAIELPWLARTIGVACWLTAPILLYWARPTRSRKN